MYEYCQNQMLSKFFWLTMTKVKLIIRSFSNLNISSLGYEEIIEADLITIRQLDNSISHTESASLLIILM